MANKEQSKKQLTGRHVLLMLLAFFGVTILVNVFFTVAAVKTFRGEDVKRSYRQGLEYNQTLDARAAQETLGWSARANLVEKPDGSQMMVVQLNDEEGRALTAVSIDGTLNHRVDTSLDQDLKFLDTGAGRWTADVEDVAGEYTLKATATQGETSFKFLHPVSLN